MKKSRVSLICLCVTAFILCTLNAYALPNTPAQDDGSSLYNFDFLSFLKIESDNFSALQIYNGEVYIRDGFNYKVYRLDPGTGLLTMLNSADDLFGGMTVLSGKMFYPEEIKKILENIKNRSSEIINLVLNLMIVIVWLPTAYICIG